MANSTIPNLVAVSVPAGTDLLGVRQSGDTRDKKLTVTQLLSLAPGGGDVTKVGTPVNDQLAVWTGDGTLEGNANFNVVSNAFRSTLGNGPSILNVSSTSGTVPSLVPRQGDPNTGVSNAGDDRIALTAGGVMAVRAIEAAAVISSIDLFGPTVVTGSIRVTDAAGPQIQNEAASATNPTLLPNRADLDSGVGQNAVDQVSIIAGGVEIARATEAVASNQFALVNSGSSAVPELTGLADTDTGLHWLGSNELGFLSGGSRQFSLLGTQFQTAASTGPSLVNATAALTAANIRPSQSDGNTGIGGDDNDRLSLIAGGVVQLQVSATDGAFLQAGTNAAANGGNLDLDAGPSGVAATGDGGVVTIAAGASLATNGSGGAVNIDGGAGVGSGAGGDVILTVGSSGAAGPGTSGSFFVNTTVGLTAAAGLQVPVPAVSAIYGVGRSGEGVAGDLELWGGYAAGTGGASAGGDLRLFGGGQGGGTGVGGNAHLYGGESDNNPGFAEVEGGTATVDGQGGQVKILGGPGFGTNRSGGLVTIDGGLGIGTGNGARVDITGGVSGSGATGNGGNLHMFGGASAATNGDGGDILLGGGAEAGGGTQGTVDISGGSLLRIVGPINTNHVSMAHDNTDMNWVGISTIDWNISGITALNAGSMDADFDAITATSYEGIAAANLMSKATNQIMNADIAMLDTRALRLGTGNDVNILWDGTDLEITGAAGSQVWNFRDGPHIKIFDDSDTDSVQFDMDGTDFNTTFPDGTTTDWNIGTVNLALAARVRTANGAAGAPSHSFTGETNSGLYLQSSGSVGISCSGGGNWLFQTTSMFANIAGGPQMMFEASSATNPVFCPRLSDTDSGIGSGAADQVDLIAGGLSCMAVRETAAARQIGFYVTAPISLQTGVAVSAAAIHAALVALGLITA